MKGPIRWFGGKGKMTSKLLPLIPQHNTYVEPFFGGGSLFFAKPFRPTVINDADGDLINFFKVIADPKAFEQFHRRVALLPYSRQLYNEYRESWKDEQCEIERAVQWFVVARQCFCGNFRRVSPSWGYAVTQTQRNMMESVSKWLSAIEGLPAVHAKLQACQIECADFRKILETYDHPHAFFYLDPPYVSSTRKHGEYAHEMGESDHAEMVDRLLNLKGKVLLSCYWHEIYQPLIADGWKRVDWQTACHAAGRVRGSGILGEGSAMKKQPRVETVLANYQNQLELDI